MKLYWGKKVSFLVILTGIVMIIVSCNDEFEDYDNTLPAIRIRILNGCGFKGAAAEMRNHLSQYNVDIVGIGNADRFVYDKTIIVVKQDDHQDLERLMRYTDIDRRVYALSDDSVESFQIIVGRDYLTYLQ